MSDNKHDLMRDLVPDYVAGALDADRAAALERRMAADPDLAREVEMVRVMRAHRPEPPATLATGVEAALVRDPGRRSPRRWQLSAAAVLVLSLGTAWLWGSRPQDPSVGLDEPVPYTFPMGDGLVAGAALLDELSDEALLALLRELEG